jgi:hypothetical protein
MGAVGAGGTESFTDAKVHSNAGAYKNGKAVVLNGRPPFTDLIGRN